APSILSSSSMWARRNIPSNWCRLPDGLEALRMIETLPKIPPAERPKTARFRGFEALAARERVSDQYWSRWDPINELRTWWRAQTVRHMFHILPGESILELGCGSGTLTRALVRVTRGESPITAATFHLSPAADGFQALGPPGEVVRLTDF